MIARALLHELDAVIYYDVCLPCVSKQCPADGVWRIGRGVSPDRVRKTRLPLRELRWTRFTPSVST